MNTQTNLKVTPVSRPDRRELAYAEIEQRRVRGEHEISSVANGPRLNVDEILTRTGPTKYALIAESKPGLWRRVIRRLRRIK